MTAVNQLPRIVILATLAAAHWSCGGGGGGEPTGTTQPPPPPSDNTVASVSLTPASATLASLGESLNLTAEAKDAAGGVVTGAPIGFTSSDVSIATVNASGVVVAVDNGVTAITASVDGRSAQTTITVAQVATTTLLISPAMATLASLGETVNFTATAADALANAITSGFTWQTGDGSVATVSSTSDVGGVTSVGNGSTTVTVSRDGMAVSSNVVVQQAVSSVVVSPGSATLLEDFTQQLSGDPQDANGNTVAAATVAWASSNGAVATVDNAGLVTGVLAGSATITATADAVPGTAQITVEVVTLTNHVQPIFTSNCALSGCHIAPNPEEGQDLSTGQAWSNIVNVVSVQANPAMNRVTPGDPSQSYLVHKIEGTQGTVGGSGVQMPFGLPPLSSQDMAIIRSWITKGALNN